MKTVWCKETSNDSDNWTEDNPAYGQCAVTSLLFACDILKAEIARYTTNPDVGSHYCLHVINDNGEQVILDPTLSQFDGDEYTLDDPLELLFDRIVPAEELLANEDTKRRYEILKERYFLQERNTGWA